ncbi:MAG: DUF1648 domain-containing protein [Chloroflexota bacterium]
MTIRWQRELPQWLLILAMFAVAAATWSSMPDRIPVHWNITGQVDRYGGKAEGLLALPILALVIYLVLLLSPRLFRATEAQLGGVYVGVRIAVLVFLAVLYGLILLQVRNGTFDIAPAIMTLVGLLFVGLGSVMGRMRPNAIMGIRTPWTLRSEASWVASQRLGGWLFIASGVLFVVTGLLGQPWLLLVTVAVLFIGTIYLTWYGYRVFRDDPNRLPQGQSLLSR